MSIDPNNLAGTAHITFDDEFNNLSLWNGSSGTWATTYWYQDPYTANGGTLPSNGEQEWYINSNYGPTASVKPWTVNNGVLTITATPTPSWLSGYVNNYSYISGELNSYHSFAQTYGYFEMRAELPAGQGFWPAFWLMPTDGSWPPELDIMEALGQNPTELVTTSHSAYAGMESLWTQVPNMTTGYHTYGVDWEPDYITWYFDGNPVYQIATPADMNKPMYIIANLAVGGNWPGSADGYSSAQFEVDYIRAYASGGSGGSSAGSGAATGSTPSGSTSTGQSSGDVIWGNWAQVNDTYYTAPSGITNVVLSGWGQSVTANNQGDTIYSNDAENWIAGGTGNDTFYLGRGGDHVWSNGGADTFVFQQVPWTAAHISGFSAQDVLDLPFLQTYGYWGSDAIADGRVKLVADGAGGTQVWTDLDGLQGVSGTYLVATLDGISPANLAWQNGHLVDPPAGSSSTPPSSGGSGSTGLAAGDVIWQNWAQVNDTYYTAPSGITNVVLSGWGQAITGNNQGDTIYSNDAENWIAGGTGNDTFYLGRGGDHVWSNGGTDTFVFQQVPWTAAHIYGFSGPDVLDLAFLKNYGYWGSDPVADGHVKLVADGAGGTQVWTDLDGLQGVSGTYLVATLDGISPANLAWQNGHLVDPPAGSSSAAPSPGGQTFTSDNNGDVWIGGTGSDVFNLGRGGDWVTGGGGADTFKFAEVPWNGGHITDFSADDTLDLSAMFQRYGYGGSNPVADGRLGFADDGHGGTQVWVDLDGLPIGTGGTWLVTTLDHVASSSLHVNGAFITG